jgi:hypothetical protein
MFHGGKTLLGLTEFYILFEISSNYQGLQKYTGNIKKGC